MQTYDKNEDKNQLGYCLGVIPQSSQTYEVENVITLHKTIADYTYSFLLFFDASQTLFFEEISNIGQ